VFAQGAALRGEIDRLAELARALRGDAEAVHLVHRCIELALRVNLANDEVLAPVRARDVNAVLALMQSLARIANPPA